MCLQYKSFENTVGKGEIARNEQFLLFPQFFLPFRRTFRHFRLTKHRHLQALSIWKGLKFVVWERVKEFVDENFKFVENGKEFSKRVGNTVGKGEIACYEQFLLFPQCFRRFLLQTRKNKGLFGKGLNL